MTPPPRPPLDLIILSILLLLAATVAGIALLCFLWSSLIMVLWNLAIPHIFGLPSINALQALGLGLLLLLIAKLMR